MQNKTDREMIRQLISMEEVPRGWWEELYCLCREIIDRPGEYREACRGRILAALFYEASTRTNFSFRAAMQRLGGTVFGFTDPASSSVSKGESLADTVRICANYADTIVMRTPWEGAAYAASLYSDIPVINAGDGGHMHPTQTLADLTTICEKRGSPSGLKIGICGDLKYGRTVHSLISALSMFENISYSLISPPDLVLPTYMRDFLGHNGQPFDEISELDTAIPYLDILYMTRIQKERFTDPAEYERNKGLYVLTKKKLIAAKKDMLVMHPLPRVDEIAPDVDDDPRAVYFEQVRYGMYIRMALLCKFCNMERLPPVVPAAVSPLPCSNPNCITHTEAYLPYYLHNSADGDICAYCHSRYTNAVPIY